MTPKQRLLADYARRIIGGNAIPESLGGISGGHLEAATSALESVRNDSAFRPGDDAVLEAIILPQFRPAVFIKDDTFDTPPDPWAHVAAFATELKPVIRAIGRVEVQNAGVPFGGTGFLCGPGLMLTNRHVAGIFTFGVGGPSKLRFIPGRTAGLDTARERFGGNGITFIVEKTIMVHPHWDAALLKIRPAEDGVPLPAPLSLAGAALAEADQEGREVVVVGYPYWSDGHDPKIMKDVFGGIFGVKRLQPGKLIGGRQPVDSFAHRVEAISHDSSTLGGNSGSAVIDLVTQQVLGLHFSGTYLKANYAVPVWELARDPRVVDAGVNFAPAPAAALPRTPEAGGPVWLNAWKGREEPVVIAGQPAPAEQPVLVAGPEALPPAKATILDPGWFERCPDEELRRMYQRDPDQTRSLLASSYSPEEAQEMFDTLLVEASTEGVLEAPADPSLPEIVLLPGIMGSHLRGSVLLRSWLNLLTLPFANLNRSLGLDRNGNDPNGLSADGYIESFYAKAARSWRHEGFKVHEFSFDWRKPLSMAVRRLDSLMRERRQARPEARFALVGHSMGCLVSSLYARQVSDWRDFVDQAILCGGPLGGSFAIMEMLSGDWPFVQKLAKISRGTSLKDMQMMGASFPGALEMLPHPALFSRDGADVELLYRSESYSSIARPGADWLHASRNLKDALRDTPLLGRATCLVCVDRPTATTFVRDNGGLRHSPITTRGDGTVAAVSALISGVPAFRVDFEHGDLMSDPKVLAAVPMILKGNTLPLQFVTLDVLKEPLPEAPRPSPEALSATRDDKAAQIRERMRTGLSTVEDVRWLMRTD